MEWFDEARFGVFVHWGHSSQQGIELSWPLVGGGGVLPGRGVGVEQYHATAATFDPVEWDPAAFARRIKAMGAGYAVLTSRHHDGFSMFDTALSDYKVTASPYGRDIVRGYADALREEGIRVGLYYSLSDWHHPDYPAFREENKPYRFGRLRQPEPEQWERYLPYLFGQVRELLTNYGRIDVLWFDGQWERTPEQWHAAELLAMVRELQPGILVNDRLPGAGDIETPEQFVPPEPPGHRWETCMTMNESWGYNPEDPAYKSSTRLIHTLCEVAGRGGNLLLNVSPMGNGALPPEQVERMDAITAWMAVNREAIVGTEPGLAPWQFYGPTTRRGGTIYLHLLMRPLESVSVRGIPVHRVQSVRALGSGADLPFERRTAIIDQLTRNREALGELTIAVPEEVLQPHATVLAVEL